MLNEMVRYRKHAKEALGALCKLSVKFKDVILSTTVRELDQQLALTQFEFALDGLKQLAVATCLTSTVLMILYQQALTATGEFLKMLRHR